MPGVHRPPLLPHLPMPQRAPHLSSVLRQNAKQAYPLRGVSRHYAGDTHKMYRGRTGKTEKSTIGRILTYPYF